MVAVLPVAPSEWLPALSEFQAAALVSSRGYPPITNFAFVPTTAVFSDRLTVIARDDWG